MPEIERKPLLSKRAFDLLKASGPTGKTSAQLAEGLYGENSYKTRCRVQQLIHTLRWNGHKIRAIRDPGYIGHRYILDEFIVTAVAARKEEN